MRLSGFWRSPFNSTTAKQRPTFSRCQRAAAPDTPTANRPRNSAGRSPVRAKASTASMYLKPSFFDAKSSTFGPNCWLGERTKCSI